MKPGAWLGLGLLTIWQPLAAQAIRGTVLDSASGSPIAGAGVDLLRADSRLVTRTTTDSMGGFTVRAPEPGRYQLRVQRIGFRAYEAPISVEARAEATIAIRLGAIPIELPTVTVEAVRDQFLVGHGYYRRKESERGTFLDPDQVAKLASKAKLSTDILTHIPGVQIRSNAPLLRSCRTIGAGSAAGNAPRGYGSTSGNAPLIYVDGVAGGTEMMWSLQPNDILAVEVYMGPAQIPLQYGGTSTPCGVILIWTKR